jgi:hypothetical protein
VLFTSAVAVVAPAAPAAAAGVATLFSSPADDSAKQAAREHFKQAVQLFDDRRFADSLVEFERSYALYPAFSTLYNIGEVRAALGHPVEAVDAFEKFLTQGGASISAEQRARVEAELRSERGRVGDVNVGGLPAGSEVRVDGVPVAKAPMTGSVRVAAGHHRLEAMADGYRSALREIDVPGQGHVEITIALIVLAAPTPAGASSPVAMAAVPPTPSPLLTADARTSGAEAPRAPGSAQRIAAYCVGGLGLAATGTGIVITALGQNKHDEALTQWAANEKSTARQTESDSVHQKTIGYVTMGVGGAVLVTGVVLYLTAPTRRPSRTGVNFAPWIGTSAAGATLEGQW